MTIWLRGGMLDADIGVRSLKASLPEIMAEHIRRIMQVRVLPEPDRFEEMRTLIGGLK